MSGTRQQEATFEHGFWTARSVEALQVRLADCAEGRASEDVQRATLRSVRLAVERMAAESNWAALTALAEAWEATSER